MPYHLESGSNGFKFPHHGLIVVNSLTGAHMSLHPIPPEKAKAQIRILEEKYKEEKSKKKK